MVKIEDSWFEVLNEEFSKPYISILAKKIKEEYSNFECYPPASMVYEAFNQCSFNNTKVIILGQDPYHGLGQAHGLSFSVLAGVAFPPSLRNIFKELNDDVGISVPSIGNLDKWAKQGVLLLNATLTVRANEAGSHQKLGWEIFTDAVINKLNTEKRNLVFILWGNYAQNKGRFIDTDKHLVLKASHPSPLSANRGGWFGNKHFSKTNAYLKTSGLNPISW